MAVLPTGSLKWCRSMDVKQGDWHIMKIYSRVVHLLGVLLVLSVLRVPLLANAEVPAEVVIGVPPFHTDESFLQQRGLAQRIVLAAVTDPLLAARPGKANFSMVFSDSFQVDAAGVVWSYRVRQGMVFSNGAPVKAQDLCYSLIRCAHLPNTESAIIDSCTVRAEGIEGVAHNWIDVRFSGLPDKRARQQAVVQKLSSCPILHQKSSEIFAEDLAKGSNLLASGEFYLNGFLTDKSVQLKRFQRDRSGRTIPQQIIELKGFSSMKDALTALRVGTIGLFFNTDPDIEKSAISDETLRVSDCGAERVIYRRGFQFSCGDVIVLSTISWDLTLVN
jgi:hypothetical protein